MQAGLHLSEKTFVKQAKKKKKTTTQQQQKSSIHEVNIYYILKIFKMVISLYDMVVSFLRLLESECNYIYLTLFATY